MIKLHLFASLALFAASSAIHIVFLYEASAVLTAPAVIVIFFNTLNACFLSAALFRTESRVKFAPFGLCVLVFGYSFAFPADDDQLELINERTKDGIPEFSSGSLQAAKDHFAYVMFNQLPGDFCDLNRLLKKYDAGSFNELQSSYREVEANWEKTNEWLVPYDWGEAECIETLARAQRVNDYGRQPEARTSFEYWLKARPDRTYYSERDQKYPVFLISAQGGGIYAAAHVSYFLSYIQSICPSFAQHVFAISGVSGGSVGAALFAANVDRTQPEFTEIDCALTPLDVPPSPEPVIEKVISRDHVSPLLGMMLGPDILEDLVPSGISRFERTATLRDSFGRAFEDLTGNDFFYRGLSGAWNPDGSVPALLMNTTEVRNGRRLSLSPFSSRTLAEPDFPPFSRHLGDHYFIRTDGYKKGMTVGDAAFASARFPFVTGSATIAASDIFDGVDSKDRQAAAVQLVDGGYSDNSGAETLFELYDLLEPEFSDRAEFFIISFSGTTEDRALVPSHPEYSPTDDNIPYMYITNFDHLNRLVSDAYAPLSAFLGSRVFRSQLAIERLKRRSEGTCFSKFVSECVVRPRFLRINLDDAGLGLPLGWTLGSSSLSALRSELPNVSQCDAPAEINGFTNNDLLRNYVRSQGDPVLRNAFELSTNQSDLDALRQDRASSNETGLLPDELRGLVSHQENCWPILVREILFATFKSESDEYVPWSSVVTGRW